MRSKRNERPGPEFWVRFDREFKAKQKLLIQKQLVDESRLKSPLFNRFYRIGALTATCGIAVVAVYLGFQTPIHEQGLALQEGQSTAPSATPSFAVASTASSKSKISEVKQQPAGLQEFATLAQSRAPKIVVQSALADNSTKPTRSQLTAMETLASLEETIRANRASGPAPTPSYQFVSSNGLFETAMADQEEDELEGVWDFENAFMLGRYADPLTGTLSSGLPSRSLNDIQQVSLSQLDEALSNTRRQSSRSLDALTVRF